MDDILYRFQRISYYVTQSVDLYFEKVYKYKYIYIYIYIYVHIYECCKFSIMLIRKKIE